MNSNDCIISEGTDVQYFKCAGYVQTAPEISKVKKSHCLLEAANSSRKLSTETLLYVANSGLTACFLAVVRMSEIWMT